MRCRLAYDWAELPDVTDVHAILMKQAELKARLKMSKLELEIYQAELAYAYPRNAAVRIVGVDDTSKARLRELLSAVVGVESELDSVDAEAKFNNHRMEAAKALAYKNRM